MSPAKHYLSRPLALKPKWVSSISARKLDSRLRGNDEIVTFYNGEPDYFGIRAACTSTSTSQPSYSTKRPF